MGRTEVIGLNAFLASPQCTASMPVRSSKANPEACSSPTPKLPQGHPERQLESGMADYVELLTISEGLRRSPGGSCNKTSYHNSSGQGRQPSHTHLERSGAVGLTADYTICESANRNDIFQAQPCGPPAG
jgi:hypothetical protein